MVIDGGERFKLEPLTLCSFDGGVPVESWGQCTDFNLMLRKGQASGSTQSLKLTASTLWTPAVPAPKPYPNCTVAIYCVSGDVTVEGVTAQAGQFLLCREADDSKALQLDTKSGAEVMISVIYTK